MLVTSATLADSALDDPFALAEMRTGAARFPDRPKTLRLASPFDYAANARAFVVTDVGREDPRQVAAAMRELFLAAGGGALGLFTAIRRLRAVYDRIAAPLAEGGLALYAQHVDPLEVGRPGGHLPGRGGRLPARHRRGARRGRRAGPLAAAAGVRPRALAQARHPAQGPPRPVRRQGL